MNWTKPLVVLIAFGIVVWAIGAAVALLTKTIIVDGGVDLAATLTLLLLVVSVAAAVAVGRRSGEWVRNPRTYW